MIRLNVGPSPTTASFTTNPSGLRLALFSALAIALFNVLLMRNAAFLGVKASRSSAAETGRPWISRVTSRALNGEIRAYLYIDLTSMLSFCNSRLSCLLQTHVRLRIHLEAVPNFYCLPFRIHFLNHRAANLLAHIHYTQGRDPFVPVHHAHWHPNFYALFLSEITNYK